jgi:hypothetical protein
MSITLFRVVNQQTLNRSILIDKCDDGQANTPGYAQYQKQRVYIPFSNPLNTAVKGYTDFVPTDRVLLSANNGTISGLVTAGRVALTIFNSALVAAPVITGSTLPGASTSIAGTTFTSLAPDLTSITLTNLVGATQTIPSSSFTVFNATTITFLDATSTIGVPAAGWTAQVFANSKYSNIFVLA